MGSSRVQKKYSQEFKEKVFQEVEEVGNVPIVAKKNDVPIGTIHSWLRKRNKKIEFKSSLNDSQTTSENKRLQKRLAEKEAEILILRDLLKKTYQVWSTN